ncbi:HD-GYP domain-containing protein [Brevibacillus sp. B_LB10_24]|uniref:HD-GYP domain-containing protein n=1 Tax=Brevibacillus sp. B_LB10_24 TaxID=3380645 RepID=UPI0038BC5469
MRLISVNRCQPGQKIAKSIYTNNGTVLIGAGVFLTQRMINRLQEYHISAVYIDDELTSDIIVEDVVSEQTRREAMGIISETFKAYQIDPKRWRQLPSSQQIGQKFRHAVLSIIDELKGNQVAMNLLGSVGGVDNYVFYHSFHVTLYATSLGVKLGLDQKELTELGIGAILHDIGKMAIPSEILTKPDKLTNEEYKIMQKHTEYGFELLRKEDDIPLLAAHCAYQHHERCDGSGYPRGLVESEIHRYGKILGICDVFDAMTTSRVYRKAMLPHEAMEELFLGTGKLFNQEMVEHFRDTIALYPIGLTVTLNTGEEGIVVDYNRGAPSRPILRVIKEPNGERVASPYEIDLSKHLNIMIASCDYIL